MPLQDSIYINAAEPEAECEYAKGITLNELMTHSCILLHLTVNTVLDI